MLRGNEVEALGSALSGDISEGEVDLPLVYEALVPWLSSAEMRTLGQYLELCPVHYCDIRICIDDNEHGHEVYNSPHACNAIEGRADLTETLQKAISLRGAPLESEPHDGSERSLTRTFEIVRGIVAEYQDGGDQVVELCSCDQHTKPNKKGEAMYTTDDTSSLTTYIEDNLPQATAEAVVELEKLMAKILVAEAEARSVAGVPPSDVTVYTWGTKYTGPRIAEISALWRDEDNDGTVAGISWMRSDADSAAVLFQAEDFLLAYKQPPEHWDPQAGLDGQGGWTFDPENEARWRLAFALSDNNEDVANLFWEKRDPPEQTTP